MDVKDFKEGKVAASNDKSGTDYRWWLLKGDLAAASVTAALAQLQEAQDERLRQLQASARLYGNVSLVGLQGLSQNKGTLAPPPQVRDRMTFNLVQSAIDTVTSKIAKNKPRPLFLTSGGDYKQQRKAKKLTQFTDGILYENKAHALGVDIFRDAAVLGDGLVKVVRSNGRVRLERALASELWVDEVEGFYGLPRSLHQVRPVDRATLKAAYPDKAKKIDGADKATAEELGAEDTISDMVVVRESWHLPSGPDAKDGRHLISIDGLTIVDEEWARDHYPFARLPWSKRLFGFWAQGAAEQLQGTQLELNKLLWVAQRSYHLGGSFKVLLERGSKVVKEHLDNDVGTVIEYTGTPPQYVTAPILPMEMYQQIETLVRRGYELVGVSQLSAMAQKPAGLNSGKALREYNDIESDRFQTIGHAYEDFFLEIARLAIETAKEIAEEEGGYEVRVPDRKAYRTVNWSEIDLGEDDFVMKCYPVSSLPNDPAGRLQTVQEYIQAGFLSPRQGKRLLDFPDLEQVESLHNAAEDRLTEVLDKIVDEGAMDPPEPFDDLTLAREMALEYYQRGKTQGLEDERMELLRVYIGQVDQLQQAAAQPPPGAGMDAGMGSPQAPPMPAAPSDLVANVPAPIQ